METHPYAPRVGQHPCKSQMRTRQLYHESALDHSLLLLSLLFAVYRVHSIVAVYRVHIVVAVCRVQIIVAVHRVHIIVAVHRVHVTIAII